MSHFGRPKGRKDLAFSLRPLIAPLSRAIGGREVIFAEDCIGEEAKRAITMLRPGQVALLENLRFEAGEEANAPQFAQALAELGDIYVDAAFSAAHRAHASIDALARLQIEGSVQILIQLKEDWMARNYVLRGSPLPR